MPPSVRGSRAPTWVIANLSIFAGAIAFGFLIYRGRIIGFGDAMNMFRPSSSDYPSLTGFARYWYVHGNGRLGGFLIDGLFQRLAAYGRFTPVTYPWWLLVAVSLFGTLAVPVNLGYALARVAGTPARVLLWPIVVLLLLWTGNQTVYETTLLGQAVGEYFSAFYFISLAVVCVAAARENSSLGSMAAAGALYFQASISYEQVLLAGPVIFTALSVVKWREQCWQSWRPAREAGLWLLLTAGAALIVSLSPGQRQRQAVVFVNILSLVSRLRQWLAGAIQGSYSLVIGHQAVIQRWCLWIHVAILACLTAAIIADVSRHKGQWLGLPQHRLRVVALGFLLAVHAGTAHLIFSDYAPVRAFIFPGLCLLIGLACAALSMEVAPTRWAGRFGRWALLAVAAIILLGDVSEARLLFKREVWMSKIRSDVYARVIDEHRRSSETHFRLSRCPLPDLEAPWGIHAYLAWLGYDGLAVAVEGRDELTPGAKVVECRVPPLLSGDVETNAGLAPVRSISYVTADGRGVAAYDYWIAADIDECDAVIAGNPNVAGSPFYRDVARYAIVFGNIWDGSRSDVVRHATYTPLAVATTGGLRVEGTFAWNGAEMATVPVSAWRGRAPGSPGMTENSPFLRLAIVHLTPANVGAYDRVTLQCR